MAPRIESMSQHRLEVGQQEKIFVNGSGFVDVQGVAIGDTWASDFRVDGDSVITVTLPSLAADTHWVVVWTNGGESSSTDGPNQQLEIVAAGADGEHSELRITSITPEEIVLPLDGQPFWLQGTGLSRVTAAMTGHHAITFEGYDETRLQIWLPAQLEAEAGHEVVLEVLAGSASDSITVPVRGRPANEAVTTSPSIMKVEPASVPASGGDITVTGLGFTSDLALYIGDTACTGIDIVTDGLVRCTVPPIEGHDGEALLVFATSNGYSSPNMDVLLLITPE